MAPKRKRTWLQVFLIALIDFAGLAVALYVAKFHEFTSRTTICALAGGIVLAAFCISDFLGGRLARLIEGPPKP